MSFALPTALLLAALGLPIIALYILKVRLRRVPVSTNLFWRQVYDEKPPRSLWQNLRHLLSLLAQLLLLLLLVLAIADPYFFWQALQARRLVMVVDTSASMQATDVSPSRFEAARTAVHRVLDGLRFRDEVAIVSAGSRPEVVLGMAGHIPTLRRAIDSIQPVDGAASLDAAVDLAKQLIGDHPHGQVLVFSDGCAQRPIDVVTTHSSHKSHMSHPSSPDLQSAPTSDAIEPYTDSSEPEVIYRTIASAAANIGITQFQTRRSLVDPIGYEILVTVRNASASAVQGRLELELEGIPVDILPLNLKAEESWTRSIEKTSLGGGLLQASITQVALATGPDPATESPPSNQDAGLQKTAEDSNPEALNMLSIDDIAWAIVPPRVVQNVLIVTPGNLFLQKVFEANPLVNITVRSDMPTDWPADTIVVLHRLVPEVLPTDNVLVVDPESDSELWTLGDVIENPIVTELDETSPLMTHIRLDNVLMPQARRLDFKQPFNRLAAIVTGETVYASMKRPGGSSCLVLSVNLESSDLAFRTAFPILITNALSWFAGQPGELQPSIAAGQLTVLNEAIDAGSDAIEVDTVSADAKEEVEERTPTGSEAVSARNHQMVLVSPSGEESTLPGNQIGPLNEVGVWSVYEEKNEIESADTSDPLQGLLLQRIAVILADANETDLRPDDEVRSAAESMIANAWFTRPVWFYLIVVACLFCTLEWFLYQRRFIS